MGTVLISRLLNLAPFLKNCAMCTRIRRGQNDSRQSCRRASFWRPMSSISRSELIHGFLFVEQWTSDVYDLKGVDTRIESGLLSVFVYIQSSMAMALKRERPRKKIDGLADGRGDRETACFSLNFSIRASSCSMQHYAEMWVVSFFGFVALFVCRTCGWRSPRPREASSCHIHVPLASACVIRVHFLFHPSHRLDRRLLLLLLLTLTLLHLYVRRLLNKRTPTLSFLLFSMLLKTKSVSPEWRCIHESILPGNRFAVFHTTPFGAICRFKSYSSDSTVLAVLYIGLRDFISGLEIADNHQQFIQCYAFVQYNP